MKKMKDAIKKSIKKNDLLYALANVILRRNDPKFMRMLTNMACCTVTRPMKNAIGKSAIFYYDCDTVCGLFWYLRRVLEVVYFCDRMGFVPQILWSKSLYYDESMDHSLSPFEYYFYQPIQMSEEEEKLRSVIEYAPDDSGLTRALIGKDDSIYEGNKDYIDALASIAKIALQYKPETRVAIDGFIQRYGVNSDTLGVHARGSDFRKKFKNHPVFVETKEYYSFVDFAIKEYGFKKIFLATDDQVILNEFLKHYPNLDIVYANDVHRSKSNEGIHTKIHVDSKSSPYREGLSALCDMAALASCGGLISGISNVSLIARVVSKSEGNLYKYDKVISKGFNSRGIDVAKITFSKLK